MVYSSSNRFHWFDAALPLFLCSHLPEGFCLLLSDVDIRQRLGDGRIGLDPFDDGLIQPASVDVRLGTGFRVFESHSHAVIDPAVRQEGLTRLVEASDGFILHPGEFVLECTLERVTLDCDVAARLEGKSSLGRLGLLTHATAGFIDPGFSGHVTLELSNVANLPIKLYPGMKIGQLCFFAMSSPVARPYGDELNGSHYQGQEGPTESRSWERFSVSGVI